MTSHPAHPVDPACPEHSRRVKKQDRCRCEVEVYSRVVGYYRPVQQFNPGMEAMYKDRVNFGVNAKRFAQKPPAPSLQPPASSDGVADA